MHDSFVFKIKKENRYRKKIDKKQFKKKNLTLNNCI